MSEPKPWASRTDAEKERDFQAALDEFEVELHAEKDSEERRKKADDDRTAGERVSN